MPPFLGYILTILYKKRYLRGMKQIVLQLHQSLSNQYDEREIRAITQWLLEEVCGWSRTQILLQSSELVCTEEQRSLLSDIALQMEQGVPMQYAVGYEYFCGRRFDVGPQVLIPRPETSGLINWIVDNLVNNPGITRGLASPSILDIGTGSGCIALTLAAELPRASVVAVDISEPALQVANGNAKKLGINNVEFICMDILHPCERQSSSSFHNAFSELPETYQQGVDIIVSNPPYICQSEKANMQANVLEHEPHLALFVPDSDPLLFYRAIADYGLLHLKEGGWLYFEINAAYGEDTCWMMREKGYADVELKQDYVGRDRFVRGKMVKG